MNHTGVAKNAENTWIDNVHASDGLICCCSWSGNEPFNLDDILAEDQDTTNGWGVIRKIGGVFYLAGKLTFGDASGSNGLNFKDESQVVVFEDRPVSSTLYAFDAVANSALKWRMCGN